MRTLALLLRIAGMPAHFVTSRTLFSIAIVIPIIFVSGCSYEKISPVQASQTAKRWKLSPGTEHKNHSVLSGTTFQCDGMTCRLLGVKDSADPEIRKQAELFTKTWFESIGDYFGFYNDSNPLVTDDGTAIVWVLGMDSHMSCLSEELVRAGLVEIDNDSFENYAFTVPGKDRDYLENWRERLQKAKESSEKGEPLQVLFTWPPENS